MLKSRETYEIMSPETIGLQRADGVGLTFGKHSGRHALSKRLQELGYSLDKDELNSVFVRFKVGAPHDWALRGGLLPPAYPLRCPAALMTAAAAMVCRGRFSTSVVASLLLTHVCGEGPGGQEEGDHG